MFLKILFSVILFILIFNKSLLAKFLTVDDLEDYILKNPEIIIKSLSDFEKKKDMKVLERQKQYLTSNFNLIKKPDYNLFSGKTNAKKIIIEFFDYNCGYCKRAHKEIMNLLDEEGDLKIIYKNLPILSKQSTYLAKLSLALGQTNNRVFLEFHKYIFNLKKIDQKSIELFFKNKKIDFKKIQILSESEDINTKLEQNLEIANRIGISGTPAYIIKNELISGFIGKSMLKSLLDKK
ncbi:MAG: hypothetical protein CMP25_03350 [Rickettsiales bacterium]|nr:hypothetical protein [Rickettsiales bacterium]